MSDESNNITTETETQQSALSLNDLQNAAQIIDVAVSRGAFRASEAAQVGAIYNKLTTFIQSTQAAQSTKISEQPQSAAA
jgi:uncharacterized surface protein with fasciclin (FAS1) repeats